MSKRVGWACALAFAALVLVHAARTARYCYTGGGDSPYYLMMAKSLVRDGDLRLSPRETSYEAYFDEYPVVIVPRVFSKERPYCWHPVGAALLFAPAYAIAGRRGVLLEVGLMSLLAAAMLFLYLRHVTGDPHAAGLVTLATAFTVPFLPLWVNEYTEMPALMLQLSGLALLARLDASRPAPGRLFAIGMIAGFLPWLHARYAPLALALVAFAVVRSGSRPRRAAWALAPSAAAVVALYAWGVHVTGGFSLWLPATLSGGNQAGHLSLMTFVRRGLPGHLTDQQGGLLVYAPLWALAVLGLRAAWDRWRREMVVHLAYGVPTFVAVASYYNWSGHWGVPCRFLTTLLPGLALALVPVARAALDRGRAGLAALAPGLAWSLAHGLLVLVWPPLALSLEGTNVNLGAPFVFLYLRTGIDLLTAFPRFVNEPAGRDYLIAFSVLCVAAAWVNAVRRVLAGGAARCAAVVLVLAFGVHAYVDRATRPPGDPLAEDERWPHLDSRYLMSYPAHYELAAFRSLRAGKHAIGRRCLERVIEVRPDWPPAWAQMAVVMKRAGEPQAASFAQRGLAVLDAGMRDHPDRLFWEGYLKLMLDDEAGVKRALTEYLKQPGPQEAEARKILEALSGAGTAR